MAMSPVLFVHICGATIGLLSGYMALLFRKGSGLHGAAGNVFFIAMLSMSASGAYIAAFVHPIAGNVIAALVTFYLVATAWRTARRRNGGTNLYDVAALLLIFVVGAAGLRFGFQAAASVKGSKDGIPAAAYFVFGSVAMLCALGDVRMIMRGGIVGARRIARHLWRMCLALLIATFSFFPGQTKIFSRALRAMPVLYLPHILLLGAMIFWLIRVSVRK